MDLITNEEWARRCANDGEFLIAARHWNGGIRLCIGERELQVQVTAGVVSAGAPADMRGVVTWRGPEQVWRGVLAAHPPRFHNDLQAALTAGLGLTRSGDPVIGAQYYGATMRAVELLRDGQPDAAPMRDETGPTPRFDAPVGRYVHLQLGGHDHRVYYETAGQGIPLLLQHTAGCHGSQWRHLFEMPEITASFQLIAYDLPYHGKSIPPVDKAWWAEPYQLRGDFLRSVPVQLARALELQRPVFMGCSVGGLLALDLALHHPDMFRAVISVEGALDIEGNLAHLQELWHPQVGNEYKARAMDGLMSPSSPLPYRRETSFVYASGWPPSFLGDLAYYIQEFDLRDSAQRIDTSRVGVHILSGEYDYSGRSELGRAAHEAIAGSTWAEMKGVGHFPMSENPVQFLDYLRPVLARIR